MRDGQCAEGLPTAARPPQGPILRLPARTALRAKTGQVLPGAVLPFVQELVFLHHPEFVCDLPASFADQPLWPRRAEHHQRSARHLRAAPRPGAAQPGVGGRQPPARRTDERRSSGLPGASARSVPGDRRALPLPTATAGVDWPAFHHVDAERHARIRFYNFRQAPSADIHARASRHLRVPLLSRLRYDGRWGARRPVNEPELGVGLVFPSPGAGDTPLGPVGWPNTVGRPVAGKIS